jgi:hypothetical protein
MAAGRRSLQDRIRERQQSGFVGRQGQVIQYQENFGFSVDDERRRFLFNIHGDAGVGKTFLTRQLRQIATGAGALTAYTDETAGDVAAAMTAIAEQLSHSGSKLGDFEKRAAEYQQRRYELESDPQAPAGVAAFLTKTAVTIGLAAGRDIPVIGSFLPRSILPLPLTRPTRHASTWSGSSATIAMCACCYRPPTSSVLSSSPG